MSKTMNLNKYSIRSLQREYDNAVRENLEQFEWQGHALVTGYAKYLLEYARDQLKLPPQA